LVPGLELATRANGARRKHYEAESGRRARIAAGSVVTTYWFTQMTNALTPN
jgi:hypothetical protein